MTTTHLPALHRRALLRSAAITSAGTLLGGCGLLNTPIDAERARFVSGPVGRLHVVDAGQGTALPVVLVHGFGGSTAVWDPQIDHLKTARRVVALDLRGHGQSDVAPRQSDYEVPAMAGDIAAVADALGLQRFALVGHSLGASVATAYAAAHPQRVAGLVMVGPPGRADGPQAVQWIDALRNDYAGVTRKQWDVVLKGATSTTDRMVRPALERVTREVGLPLIGGLLSYDPNPALQAYTGPKLIIDTPTDGDGPGALYQQQPGIPHQRIEGASHWPQLDKPREFDRLIDEFLSTLR
jgi:pimeloyl-ACP methyl ester carboxylesterase